MTNTSQFGALTLEAKPAASLEAADVVTAIDGMQTSRSLAPGQFVGFNSDDGPQAGDTAGLWLPVVRDISKVMAGNQTLMLGQNWGTAYGPVTIVLTPPPRLAAYYTSPLVFTLAPGDLVMVATGTF